jgi:hypothetical protein
MMPMQPIEKIILADLFFGDRIFGDVKAGITTARRGPHHVSLIIVANLVRGARRTHEGLRSSDARAEQTADYFDGFLEGDLAVEFHDRTLEIGTTSPAGAAGLPQ